MADIFRTRVQWTGWRGAPGVSTFFSANQPSAGNLDRLKTFFDTIKSGLPVGTNVSVLGDGDQLDPATGNLTGVWSVAPPAPVFGLNNTASPGPTGLLVHWLTSSFFGGRRVRGRTFIVPTAGVWEVDGTPTAAYAATLKGAADQLIADWNAIQLVVWHRPVGGAGGFAAPVNASKVPDLAVVLRSRRD